MGKRAIVFLSVAWMVLLVAGITAAVTLSLSGIGFALPGDATGQTVLISADEYERLKRYDRLDDVISLVDDDYYIDTDADELMQGAIDGALASLGDPYTFYYTPTDMEASEEHSSGIYEGVGMQITTNESGNVVVTRTFEGSPAREAGLRAGDIILEVDGRAVATLADATNAIKDSVGDQIPIAILRDGEAASISVVKAKVTINRVEHTMLDEDIGYIMLYEFMGDDVTGFKAALDALKAQGMRALVLDLRSNPGGLLDDVVDIADELLPEGLTVYIENRAGERESYYSDANSLNLPLAVLVNGMSASASEILAGAVKDYGVGTIVGETTFGKGIVQTVVTFHEDGAGMQLTTARYYTPKGNSIHNLGITPDIEVAASEDFDFTQSEPDAERDRQLKAAVEALKEELSVENAG